MILRIGGRGAALVGAVKRHAHLDAIFRDVHARIDQERQHHHDENHSDGNCFVQRLRLCVSAKKLPMRRNLSIALVDQRLGRQRRQFGQRLAAAFP